MWSDFLVIVSLLVLTVGVILGIVTGVIGILSLIIGMLIVNKRRKINRSADKELSMIKETNHASEQHEKRSELGAQVRPQSAERLMPQISQLLAMTQQEQRAWLEKGVMDVQAQKTRRKSERDLKERADQARRGQEDFGKEHREQLAAIDGEMQEFRRRLQENQAALEQAKAADAAWYEGRRREHEEKMRELEERRRKLDVRLDELLKEMEQNIGQALNTRLKQDLTKLTEELRKVDAEIMALYNKHMNDIAAHKPSTL
jgi:type III secretory pathway component EscV